MRNPNDALSPPKAIADTDNPKAKLHRFGIGNWAALAILLGFLGIAIAFAVYVWNQLAGTDISTQGWIAMALGITFTAAVGVGLMVLVFYSSRRNYDR